MIVLLVTAALAGLSSWLLPSDGATVFMAALSAATFASAIMVGWESRARG